MKTQKTVVLETSADGEHALVATCSQCYGAMTPTWTDGEPVFCSDECQEAYYGARLRAQNAARLRAQNAA